MTHTEPLNDLRMISRGVIPGRSLIDSPRQGQQTVIFSGGVGVGGQ